MDNDLVITVNIGARPYKLRIDRKDEEITRKAVAKLESSIREYAKIYAFKDKQDLLAMVALEQALAALRRSEDSDYIEKDLQNKLKEIESLLSEGTAFEK